MRQFLGTRLWVTITSGSTLLAVAKLKCASPKGIPWTQIWDNCLQHKKSTVHDMVGKIASGAMSSCTFCFCSNFTKEHVLFRSSCDKMHNDTPLKRRLIAIGNVEDPGQVNTAAMESSGKYLLII